MCSCILYSHFLQIRTTVQSFAQYAVKKKLLLRFYFFSLSVSYDLPCDRRRVFQVRSEINSPDKRTGGGRCGTAGQ